MKPDPDPYYFGKLDPDPHHRQKEGRGRSKLRRGGSKWRCGGSKWSRRGTVGPGHRSQIFHHLEEEQDPDPHYNESRIQIRITVKRWVRNLGKYSVGSNDYKKNTHIRRTRTAVVE